jgi:uncharacterized OB-fold protein
MTEIFRPDVSGPAISADEASLQFFEAAEQAVLLIRRCPECGTYAAPAAPTCENCTAPASEWVPASGAAALVTWAVVHNPPHPDFATEVPFVSAIVELEEGPWMPMRLITGPGGAFPDLAAGLPLQVVFARPTEGAAYPLCTVAE